MCNKPIKLHEIKYSQTSKNLLFSIIDPNELKSCMDYRICSIVTLSNTEKNVDIFG